MGWERDDLSMSEVASMTFEVCLHSSGEGAAENKMTPTFLSEGGGGTLDAQEADTVPAFPALTNLHLL